MRHRFALIASAIAVTASAIALTASGAAHAQSAAPRPQHSGMKPGMWEISTRIDSTDTATKRTITSRLCYVAEDTASPQRVLPPQRGLGAQCLVSDIKANPGGEVTWKLACKGNDGNLEGSATMRAGPTSYVAQATLGRKSGGKPVSIQEQITARRTGDCT